MVLTNRSALMGKYGTRGVARIDTALAKLIDADRGRGIATVVIALDDPEAMAGTGAAPVSDAADAAANKAAVDAVYRTYTPDYVMLLGSIDVIPHQPLRNPVYDGVNDVDRLAYGDLPYACNAPYSDDPTDFIGPDRVVGRLADVTGASTPAVLVKLLGRAASWSSRPRSDFEAHLGITANVWQRSTVLSLRKLFAAAEVHSSPGEGPGWERALLRAARPFHQLSRRRGRAAVLRSGGRQLPRVARVGASGRSCQPWDHRRRRVLLRLRAMGAAPTTSCRCPWPISPTAPPDTGERAPSPTDRPTPTAMPTSCVPTSSPPCSTARRSAGPRWRRASGSSAARPCCRR